MLFVFFVVLKIELSKMCIFDKLSKIKGKKSESYYFGENLVSYRNYGSFSKQQNFHKSDQFELS